MAGLSNERIRIRMEAYDHEVLDRTAHEIVDTAVRTGAMSMDRSPAHPHRAHGLQPRIDRAERFESELTSDYELCGDR